MPREPVVVTLGIFFISNLLYRRYTNAFLFWFCRDVMTKNPSNSKNSIARAERRTSKKERRSARAGSESRHLDQIRTQNRIQLFVSILRFLLLFRRILPFWYIKRIVFDKKSLSSEIICSFGRWSPFACVKIVGIRSIYGVSLKLCVFVKFVWVIVKIDP